MSTSEQISQTLNEFAFKLYQHLTKGINENFFISPFSISTALSMCYLGARSKTGEQLKQLLNLASLSDAQILSLNKSYLSDLNNSGSEISLSTANKIYPQLGFSVRKQFVDLLRENFFSEVEALDFSENVKSANAINSWVSGKTKEKIKDLIESSLLNEDTRMVLVNAIYFKGNWMNRFDSRHTYKEDFHLNDGTIQKVDMMKSLDKKFVFKMNPAGLRANSCEFPYVGRSLAMTIILPHEGVKLDEFEANLNTEILRDVLTHCPVEGKVHAYLPKFKIEYKTELSDNLQKLGATLPFDKQRADFSGISDDPNGLFISKVIHQAVVEVNEEGTEAAAATAVIMMKRCAIREFPPEEFKCDRPFLFIIHDKKHGGILFMGKFTKP